MGFTVYVGFCWYGATYSPATKKISVIGHFSAKFRGGWQIVFSGLVVGEQGAVP